MTEPKNKGLKALLLVSILEGAGVIALLFLSPSETGWLLGLSKQRWVVVIFTLLAEILLLISFWRVQTNSSCFQKNCQRFQRFIERDDRLAGILIVLLAGAAFLFGGWLFSYLFIPPALRWILFWGMLVLFQSAIYLAIIRWQRVKQILAAEREKISCAWKNASKVQRSTLKLLVIIGLVYFALFIIPNALDAFTPHIFSFKGGDENITYPYVVWMLSPGDTMETTVYHFFVYEDYHYGYPFYFISMLVLLPVRLLAGTDFSTLTQINLLLLRQMVSVLPMIVSALILTYLQTRFRSKRKSVALFLVILLLTGVVRYNQRFWHPDALVVLCASLTIFFMDRDKFRYGRNFYLAAFFCGLATATKLFGVFFVLSIAGYLLYGLVKKILTVRRTVWVSAGFLLVMGATVVLSNPFLFVHDARDTMMEIMQQKSKEVHEGYNEPDPEGVYQKGLAATLPYLKEPYALPFMLAFLLISVLAGFIWSDNRVVYGVLLGWVLVSGLYLIFFSAIKNYHYWLPTMIPLFSGFFGLADAARNLLKTEKLSARWTKAVQIVEGSTWVLLVFQMVWSTFQALRYWQELSRISEIFQ